MLRSTLVYMALLASANAAFAGPIDFDAAAKGGLAKLVAVDNAPAPDAAFSDIDGGTHKLSDYRGTALLVNFWATWCAPCRHEMPSLDRLQQAEGGEDFQVLTIAAGRNQPEAIRKFFTDESIETLPTLTDASMTLARQLGVMGLPVTVLFDKDGNEVARLMGDAEWDSPAALAVVQQLKAD
ncbi:MAG: TlpA disulfide reductase family protein [Paracoccus sp. (in: a-proteobacteria)]|uniref:TlpA family protein disulfide reductase n=1 Tax=Paracoccus sp. TaxID=267 RepID=UPI0026DF98C3|nr:TlpA disulfide reductase family protein [Paracoccus sp. (in: a-proteobacteria)]MDO5621842.1 TlpA disulfide reductase family protein [Paracoccus sp. (in: a-proteobacteria)]